MPILDTISLGRCTTFYHSGPVPIIMMSTMRNSLVTTRAVSGGGTLCAVPTVGVLRYKREEQRKLRPRRMLKLEPAPDEEVKSRDTGRGAIPVRCFPGYCMTAVHTIFGREALAMNMIERPSRPGWLLDWRYKQYRHFFLISPIF